MVRKSVNNLPSLLLFNIFHFIAKRYVLRNDRFWIVVLYRVVHFIARVIFFKVRLRSFAQTAKCFFFFLVDTALFVTLFIEFLKYVAGFNRN